MKYLLDTDICIYWLKGRNAVRDKINQVGQGEIAICVITVSELYFGAYNSSKVKQNLITADTFISSLSIISLSNETLKKIRSIKSSTTSSRNTRS